MVDKNKVIQVTNRDTGSVGYVIPEDGIHRRFTAGETKNLSFAEIEKLSWVPGGKEMLRDYLIIQDQEAAEEILGEVEPEYFYTKETIKTLLSNGTLEQLQDALEFGPKGVKELIKQEAVEMKLDSNVKRQEIQKATNFNVTRSIELTEGSDESEDAATSKRRANPIAASEENSTTSRTTSRYKVVNK